MNTAGLANDEESMYAKSEMNMAVGEGRSVVGAPPRGVMKETRSGSTAGTTRGGEVTGGGSNFLQGMIESSND